MHHHFIFLADHEWKELDMFIVLFSYYCRKNSFAETTYIRLISTVQRLATNRHFSFSCFFCKKPPAFAGGKLIGFIY